MIPTREQIGLLGNTGSQILAMLGGEGGSSQGTTIPEALEDIAKEIRKMQKFQVVVEKDVNFIDYDGTLLYSYSTADFAELNALPENPEHEGLTAQGWNWDLADAKAYVADNGRLWIGQMYITDDDKTRIYITIPDNAVKSLKFQLNMNGTVVVDWGDETTPDTVTGTGWQTKECSHAYAQKGDYVISLEATTGSFRPYVKYSGSPVRYFLYSDESDGNAMQQVIYCNMVQKIEIGSNISFLYNWYGFNNCESLKTITIPEDFHTYIPMCWLENCYALKALIVPKGVTKIEQGAFSYCDNLERISLPKSVDNFDYGVFSSCRSLKSVTFPEATTFNSSLDFCTSLDDVVLPANITAVSASCLRACESLEEIAIPESVTSIGNMAFSNCKSLRKILLPENLATIGDDVFGSCYALPAVTIPASVTAIGARAFSQCQGLHEIHFKGSTPPTVGTGAFATIPEYCRIFVPTGSLSDYTSAANYPDSSTFTYIEE